MRIGGGHRGRMRISILRHFDLFKEVRRRAWLRGIVDEPAARVVALTHIRVSHKKTPRDEQLRTTRTHSPAWPCLKTRFWVNVPAFPQREQASFLLT